MNRDEILALAQEVITPAVATEIADVHGDTVVYPGDTIVDDEGSHFPGWPGRVLLLSHENQEVCSWGLSLDGDSAGAVVVGGDISEGEMTVVYTSDLLAFVAARRWDRQCLEAEPLLQAQAAPLDSTSLTYLNRKFAEDIRTFGWPCDVNYRFVAGSVRIMLWSCVEQCDWWISGAATELSALLPDLRGLSDLASSLWSDDDPGTSLLNAGPP